MSEITHTGESAIRSLVVDRPVCGELGNGVWAWPVRLLLGPPYPIQEPNTSYFDHACSAPFCPHPMDPCQSETRREEACRSKTPRSREINTPLHGLRSGHPAKLRHARDEHGQTGHMTLLLLAKLSIGRYVQDHHPT